MHGEIDFSKNRFLTLGQTHGYWVFLEKKFYNEANVTSMVRENEKGKKATE